MCVRKKDKKYGSEMNYGISLLTKDFSKGMLPVISRSNHIMYMQVGEFYFEKFVGKTFFSFPRISEYIFQIFQITSDKLQND
jgi:hypothetical protein